MNRLAIVSSVFVVLAFFFVSPNVAEAACKITPPQTIRFISAGPSENPADQSVTILGYAWLTAHTYGNYCNIDVPPEEDFYHCDTFSQVATAEQDGNIEIVSPSDIWVGELLPASVTDLGYEGVSYCTQENTEVGDFTRIAFSRTFSTASLANGTYNLTLRVVDNLGYSDTETVSFTVNHPVSPPPPPGPPPPPPPPGSYALNVSINPSGGGSVSSSPSGINCPSDCSQDYSSGANVTLSPSPAGGYQFVNWSGAGCSSGTVSMTQDRNCTANFELIIDPTNYLLTITKAGSGSGTVTGPTGLDPSPNNGINCGSNCTEPYTSGTNVTITAAASPGSVFAGWSNCVVSSATSIPVTMNASKTCTATFNTVPPPSITNVTGDHWTADGGTCTISGWAYDPDSPATDLVVSVSSDGNPLTTMMANQFVNGLPCTGGTCAFSGTISVSTGVPHSILVQATDLQTNQTVSLPHSPRNITCQTVSPPPPPPPPQGLSCSPASQTLQGAGGVSVSASGGTGSYTWSAPNGSPSSGSGSPFVTSYSFVGTHSIALSDGVANTSCSVTVEPGTQFYCQVSASPASGNAPLSSRLSALAGGSYVLGSNNNFQFRLWWNCPYTGTNINTAQNQCGVLPVPASGECLSNQYGMRCSDLLSGGATTPYSNTVSPNPYANPGTYTGLCIASRGNSIARDATTVQANAVQRTLTVTKAGTGSGTVTSNPAGINCGADCTENYADGTSVTLTPAPALGSVFAGWSGDSDCSDGVVTMTGNKTCTATFNTVPLSGAVAVSSVDSNGGSVPSTWFISGPDPITQSSSSTGVTYSVTIQNPQPNTYTISNIPTISGYSAPSVSPASSQPLSAGGTITFTITYPVIAPPPEPPPPPGGNPECSDGIDNTDVEDSLVDMNDPGCSDPNDDDERDSPSPPPGPPPTPPPPGSCIEGQPECSNSCDDDGDGNIDHPADLQCNSPTDTSERRLQFEEF